MTDSRALCRAQNYARNMLKRHLPYAFSSACYLAAWPTVAADGEAGAQAVTGLTNTGFGMFIIAIAAALMTTLIFRASATRLIARLTAFIGKRRINKILHAKTADVLEDFILPGAYGGLTNIDFAVLSSGGILCIQAKHYNGVVYGEADEPQWTNTDGVQRRKFLNPLIQNEGRTRALQKAVPNVPVANVVVFTGSVQFTSPLEKECHSCPRSGELYRKIRLWPLPGKGLGRCVDVSPFRRTDG